MPSVTAQPGVKFEESVYTAKSFRNPALESACRITYAFAPALSQKTNLPWLLADTPPCVIFGRVILLESARYLSPWRKRLASLSAVAEELFDPTDANR